MQYIPKTNSIIPFNNYKIGAFIDCSGSTGTLGIYNKTYLEIEKILIKELLQDKYNNNTLYWDTCVYSNHLCTPNGGTSPSCIFNNSLSTTLFESSDIIILVTDGEIDSYSVTDFAKKLEQYTNKVLFICIIINRSQSNLSNTNISVISPLMTSNNMLCLYHDAFKNINYVISSKGAISTYFPNPTSYDVVNLQQITINDILKLEISSQKIPSNFIVISETDNEYKVIDKNDIFTKDVNLSVEEWDIIIKYCVVNNCTDKLRVSILDNKNVEIEEACTKFKRESNAIYTKKKESLLEKMLNAFANKDYTLHKQLKGEIDLIKDLAREEEIAYTAYVNDILSPIRKKYSILLNKIFDIEKGLNKYNLSTFSSNRANRAVDIIEDKEELRITHDNVPTCVCAICLDENAPAVLWFTRVHPDIAMGDYCINFPLASYPTLQNGLISNPICGICAPLYIKMFKKSVYGIDTSGYIPLDWSNKDNLKFALNTLCKTFTENKYMNHVKMLLLSIIDDSIFDWITDEVKEYVIKTLLENIITTDTLTEEGSKDTIINILPKIMKNYDALLKQPISSTTRLLKFAKHYQIIPDSELISIFVMRFLFAMIEQYSIISKNGCNAVNKSLEHLIFEHNCDIPIAKFKTCNFENLSNFFGNNYNNIKETIDKFNKVINIDIYPIVNNTLYNIIWNLINIKEHNRPLNIYKQFDNNKNFRDMYLNYYNMIDIKPIIQEIKFNKYHNDYYKYVPAFVTYNGQYSCPTKFWYNEDPLFTIDMHLKTYSLPDLVTILRENLTKKMVDNYGSFYPNSISAHTMLHRTVALVMETEFKNINEYNNQMVYSCMKVFASTNGNYGNIYSSDLLLETIAIVHNFCDIRKDFKNKHFDKSFEYKLKCELLSYGFDIINDRVKLDINKIKKPHNIDYNDIKYQLIAKTFI